MKNLMIAAVLSLGTMTAFAQEENAVQDAGTAVEETATEATEAVEETATEATEAVEESANDAAEATEAAQGDFAEVNAEELPESVTSAVSKNYPTASIDKAYVNDANQYKLEVSLEDGTAGTLYADENGNWIEM
ncbi:hypothetical protein SAMN05421636_10274 [Pricia antarctica]|uniref:Beta-lactamase-inhibitor-like, PepSY-like n=1 Tax=Pricia antarctica TaxID=641691 RepID=A0A1G6Y1B4_9FLAO|nr:hypothetical protein [Pricia antarctica]SDD84120.1 hypothetical protein SAMN05421636_10274 [Pricia antarctica]